MAAPRKYSDATRDLIHECINGRSLSGADTAAIVNERQAPELEDNPIHEATCRQIAKDEKRRRGDVEKLPRDQAFDLLSRRYLKLLDRRLTAYERSTDVEAQELHTFARALREAQPLVAPQGTESKDDEKDHGTLGHLASVPNTGAQPTQTNAQAARSLRT